MAEGHEVPGGGGVRGGGGGTKRFWGELLPLKYPR